MIAAVHRSTVAPVGAGGVGSVADGRLVLSVSSSSGVRCEVDADWAGMQSAGSLTAASGAALAAARADLRLFSDHCRCDHAHRAVLAIQAGKFATLRGEIADNSVFTGGHWPRSTAENYSDATVTDGDAEWSFER